MTVPTPNDDAYLSVAEETKARQQHPNDGVPVDAWEVRLPTTLVWLENDNKNKLRQLLCDQYGRI